jgi:hypothetical protein
MELARIRENLAQVAIDAEANPALRFLRLDVDVGRALAHREINDLVENLHQRVILDQEGEFFGGDFRPIE